MPSRLEAPVEKSTNVRNDSRALRRAFRGLEAFAPGLAARWAERLFFTPPRTRLSERARTVLASGRPLRVVSAGRPLAAWSWGEGPVVALVHGWGGRGADLGGFVPELLSAGFSVVAFDAPAHGASPGRRTSIPEMAVALRRVVDAAGDAEGLIAHSIGGPAAALALRDGLALRRAVFLAPPVRPELFTERFAGALGLGSSTVRKMKARAEGRLGIRFSDLDLASLAPRMSVPLLVVHDSHDDDVPWGAGAELARAWPEARLLTTAGLGHRRILRDRAVVRTAVAFLTGGAEGAAAASTEQEEPHARC